MKCYILGLCACLVALRSSNAQRASPEIFEVDIVRGAPENNALAGHAYRQATGKSLMRCASLCARNMTGCHSFNYCSSPKLCQLNSMRAAKQPDHMTEAQGCSYFDIAAECETRTDQTYRYKYLPFFVDVRRMEFRIRGPNDAHISLSTAPADTSDLYEIVLGAYGNTESYIRACKQCDAEDTHLGAVLSNSVFRDFWIAYDFEQGILSIGQAGQTESLMKWVDSSPVPVKYIGFSGWNAVVTFRYLCSI